MVSIVLTFLTCLIQKAESELAYELQGAKEKQKIRTEEIEIDVVERRKQIDIEEKEVLRKEKELVATVKQPAEAQAFKVEMLAEGQRYYFGHSFVVYMYILKLVFGCTSDVLLL